MPFLSVYRKRRAMLNYFCAFIFFCSGIATAAEPAVSCPQGQYLVKAHHRSAYARTDGAQVKASSGKNKKMD